MTREIKFRAWDVRAEKMYAVNNIHFPSGNIAVVEWAGSDALGANYGVVLKMNDENQVILSQYTGLKDKKGVEIYDGDILQFKSDVATRLDVRGVMEWDEARNGWSIFEPFSKFAVIGNIYENPELLK